MAFKVNYGFQKAERDRAKQAKKEAKKREKEAASEKSGALETLGSEDGAEPSAAGSPGAAEDA